MLNEEQMAEYLLYTRLQDTLMTLGTNAVLKVSANLYYEKKANNTRDFYKSEIQYITKNGKLARKILRKIDGVLMIENMKAVGTKKEAIMIRAGDIELMRVILLPWFETVIREFHEIYAIREGKLYIDKEVNAIEIVIGQSKIWFKPGMYSNQYTQEVSPCMDMYLNDTENVSKVPYDSIYAFMHVLRLLQLHQYIATMIASYEQHTMGFNMYDVTNAQALNMIDEYKYEEPEYLKKKREEHKKGFFEIEMEKRK